MNDLHYLSPWPARVLVVVASWVFVWLWWLTGR